jgi:hypothetical protein
MCLAVYVATDAPLPERKWDVHEPAFYLERVPESEGVRKQFRYAHVYYVGSQRAVVAAFPRTAGTAKNSSNADRTTTHSPGSYYPLYRVAPMCSFSPAGRVSRPSIQKP